MAESKKSLDVLTAAERWLLEADGVEIDSLPALLLRKLYPNLRGISAEAKSYLRDEPAFLGNANIEILTVILSRLFREQPAEKAVIYSGESEVLDMIFSEAALFSQYLSVVNTVLVGEPHLYSKSSDVFMLQSSVARLSFTATHPWGRYAQGSSYFDYQGLNNCLQGVIMALAMDETWWVPTAYRDISAGSAVQRKAVELVEKLKVLVLSSPRVL